MYAVVETGGKQVKCELGETIFVEKLDVEAGKTYTFDKVLAVSGDELILGAPFIDGANVKAQCEKQGRGKKIIVFKYKPKKQYRSKQGHRQSYTKLIVKSIEVAGKVTKAKAEKKTAPKAVETPVDEKEVKVEE